MVIDSVAARRAASLPPEARDGLADVFKPLLEELTEASMAEDRYRFRVADSRFHVAVLRHCGLEHVDRCYAFVHTTALSMYGVRTPTPGHLAESSAHHGLIAAAILDGDVDLAARLAEEHVRYAYNYYYGDRATTA